MKLHNLRDFIAVARTGGVRAAARELGLSQPALSKSIRQLEQELGMPLFDRTARGATLNSFGRSFLIRAQQRMRQVEAQQEFLHFDPAENQVDCEVAAGSGAGGRGGCWWR